MSKLCLFCDNKAGNREHLWPQWIHARMDFGSLKMDRNQSEQIIISNPEITVKSVCATCNNGWMSDLETNSTSTIGDMFSDLSITLERTQQEKIAAWTIKTAMMLDSTRLNASKYSFYCKQNCVAMQKSLSIPEFTRIWIGRIDSEHLIAHGVEHMPIHADTLERYVHSAITTIAVGHFVVQAITRRKLFNFNDFDLPVLQPKKERDSFFTQVWPVEREWLTWPPANSFTNGGPNGIAYLLDRWRVGEKVDPSTFADMPS